MKSADPVENILNSAKYAPVERSVIERLVGETAKRYGQKRAEDETKRLLHQVWGMYYGGAKLRGLQPPNLQAVLSLHQSTSERLPILRNFYEQIFTVTGRPTSIVDYACGLNPLAFASLGFDFPQRYSASDIDHFTVQLLRTWFQTMGVADQYSARLGDLLTDAPEDADVALLLKVLPVLELQAKGSGKKVLERQTARHIVVSFPLKSVSGREKGMSRFYHDQFLATVHDLAVDITELRFGNEMVFVLATRRK